MSEMLPKFVDFDRQPDPSLMVKAFEHHAARPCPLKEVVPLFEMPREASVLVKLAKRFPPKPGMRYEADLLARRASNRIKRALNHAPGKSKASVLELGCGRAENGFAVVRLGYAYIGVDLDERHFPPVSSGAANSFKLVQADAARLPLPDGSVDIVVSFNVCEHVKELPAMLSEIARVLKDDGVFYSEFGPLFNYAFGPHLTRYTTLPYIHHIFSDDVVSQFVRRGDPYYTVNRAPLAQYRNVFFHNRALRVAHYREHLNAEHLWARSFFRPHLNGLPYDELCTSRIDVALRKTS